VVAVSDGRLRVLVLGYIVRGPLGGLAWHHLNYVLGLAALGHDVWFLEDSDDHPACYDPAKGMTTDPAYGLRFTATSMERLGVGDRWAYHDAHTGRWLGPAAPIALELCASADVLLNVSGVNPLRPWMMEVPVRALIDTDPAFTQIKHLTDRSARDAADGHNRFFSFAGNIGGASCAVPDDGFPWRPTRQPVHLPAWPVTDAPDNPPFTTVMQWESYPTVELHGIRYGTKSMSFGAVAALPSAVPDARFEIAMGSAGTPAPVDDLRAAGWAIIDPLAVTRDPWTYQRYVQGSGAELAVAKHGYVVSHSGWFSERSVAYLASGRPVVVQDTGFSEWMEAGAGVLGFTTTEEAIEGVQSVRARYSRHARAARAAAAEYFDHSLVLGALLDACAVAAPSEGGWA
jgi:hypothetical protein